MVKRELKIGIIGVGILGGVIKKHFEENGYEVFCYDKFKNIGSVEEVNKADPVFICVPTPCDQNRECDTSIVNEAIGYLADTKIVIIKSTVIPGTTDMLQQQYPRHAILFNPEFLTARRAYADFISPKEQIVGYTLRSEGKAKDILLGLLPRGTIKNLIVPAKEAETIKYVRNHFLAIKNSIFNQVYDICQAAGINYDTIKEALENDPWIGPEHLEIWHNEKRGYNGACLPKDTEAFCNWAEKKFSIKMSILEESIRYNSELLASQNIRKDS